MIALIARRKDEWRKLGETAEKRGGALMGISER